MAITFNSFRYNYADQRGMLIEPRLNIPSGESVSSISGTLYGASSKVPFTDNYTSNDQILFDDTIGVILRVQDNVIILSQNHYEWDKIWDRYWAYKLVFKVNGVDIVAYSERNVYDYSTVNAELSKSNFSNKRGSFNSNDFLVYSLRSLKNASFVNWTGLVKKVRIQAEVSISDGTTHVFEGGSSQNVLTDVKKTDKITSLMSLNDRSIIEFQDGTFDEFNYKNEKVESFTPIKQIEIIDNVELESLGLHGSLLYDGYFYGTSRSATSSNPYSLIKIDINNTNNIKYFEFRDSQTGQLVTFIEHVVQFGKYLYMAGSRGFVRFNIETEEYVYKRGDFKSKAGSSSVPILTDGKYIYQSILKDYLQKYDIREFDDDSKFYMNPILETQIDLGSEITGNAEVHSSSLDDEFLYLAYTSYVTSYKCMIVKVRKSNLTVVAKNGMVQTTDDMTADENYLFLGSENEVVGKYGDDIGAVGVRKLDMKVFESKSLDENDISQTMSYASLFFGKTLIDSKTNGIIYIIDSESVEDWTLDKAPQMVKYRYQYKTGNDGVLQGVINELAYDYEKNLFYGFVWRGLGNNKSRYVTFKLPDLILLQKPIISYATFEEINTNKKFRLKGTLISSGGANVTECGFIIIEDGVRRVEFVSNSLGAKEFILDTNSRSVRFSFFATNSEGTEESDYVSLPILYNYDYVINGRVYYRTNTIVPNAIVTLLDTDNATVMQTTVSNSSGDYIFRDLVKDKKYFLSAFNDKYRSLSKLVIPTEIEK
ncbi:carboxypeptidase-like regulatory domain-containing protein [Empedobacter sp.]|uniref:carboxypeptidase-like regulatory domain-containing protein n=1 Tax=Empedobacter sp. TaxID=1927715 RepID=UPI00289B843B|nr:carboxypeptidase-like regulatory domain-containing protein [Empedobacter sp.]